jgi:hypothetical protein
LLFKALNDHRIRLVVVKEVILRQIDPLHVLHLVTHKFADSCRHLLSDVVATQIDTFDHGERYKIKNFTFTFVCQAVVLQDHRPNGWQESHSIDQLSQGRTTETLRTEARELDFF